MNLTIRNLSMTIWSLVVYGLVGCSAVIPSAITPTLVPPSSIFPTSTPVYIHYTPIHPKVPLEFDYPSDWIFNEEQWAEGIDILLADPRYLTHPTPDLNIPHSGITDFGSVHIWIRPLEPGQTLGSLFKDRKEVGKSYIRGEFLREYQIEVDGYQALVLEFSNEEPEMYASVMLWRIILLVVNDQSIRIDYMVSTNERGGEFEQGYEYFFNSLQIVP